VKPPSAPLARNLKRTSKMSNAATETGTAPTANVGTTTDQPAVGAGQPGADGQVAEGQPTGSEGTPASDAPPADGAAPAADGGEPAAGDGAAPEGAPEAYEEFVLPADAGLPEGTVLEPETTNAFKEAAKADNLSQAQAQRYVNLAAGLVAKTLNGYQQAAADRITQWAEQVKSDPEVGGRNYDANVQVALSVVSKYGTPELKQAFEEFGLGNHPELVRTFYRIGKAMNESGFVHGQGQEQPATPVNREAAMAARMAAEQARNK
jgi:hypothetical protein